MKKNFVSHVMRGIHIGRGLLIAFLIAFIQVSGAYAESIEPKVDAQAAILMDDKTGRVLFEKNADKPMAMASTTKIMTAILTLENANLQDTVTVSRRASLAPPVKMHLQQGEKIKLEYLMYALMMQSSNDAAVAIAEHVSGSVEEFCAAMTKKAKEIGCQDTVFETPNGLDLGDHHSTAHDLALIAQYALQNDEFKRIINTKHICVKSNRSTYDIFNKNRLLQEFNGAIGVKTGFTGKAGHCFVGAATQNGMQLISVVLASGWGPKGREQKWVDTKRILKYGFDNYHYETIVNAENIAADVPVIKSRTGTVNLYFQEGYELPLRADEKEKINIEIVKPEWVEAPVAKGDTIGQANIYINGVLQDEINLLASDSAARHDFNTSLEKIINHWLKVGRGCILEFE